MAVKGSFLKSGQYLGTQDILVSNNGLFFAALQPDGNLCVYRGTGPGDNLGLLWSSRTSAGPIGQYFLAMQGDGNLCVYKGTGPQDNKGYFWGSQSSRQAGEYFVVLQDDGNFCIYKGTGPDNNRGFVWNTQAIDPVANVEIGSIVYDVAAAEILQSGPAELYRQTVTNDSLQPQVSTITGSATVTETTGWSDSLSVKVGVSTSFKTGIPFLAEGKVQVSVDVTNTYTWNGSTSQSKTWGFNTPVSVAPHTVIVGLVTATISTIAVPYTMTGTVILKSGTRLPNRKIKGTYLGTNSHDLTVRFVQLAPSGSALLSSSPALIEGTSVQVEIDEVLEESSAAL